MENQEKIRVAIADDHPGTRRGIRRMLEKSSGIKVVAEASNGQEAIDVVQAYDPDVLILDVYMPVVDGIKVIDRLNRMDLDVSILVLSAIDDPVFKDETLSHGACSYLCKDNCIHLVELVQRTVEGECDELYDSNLAPSAVRVY